MGVLPTINMRACVCIRGGGCRVKVQGLVQIEGRLHHVLAGCWLVVKWLAGSIHQRYLVSWLPPVLGAVHSFKCRGTQLPFVEGLAAGRDQLPCWQGTVANGKPPQNCLFSCMYTTSSGNEQQNNPHL